MTEHEPTKNGKKSEDTRFQPGNPGGPGRPAGSRNKATVVLDQLADAGGREILEKLIDAAKGGDMRAADLVLSRIWPVRKGRPITLELPPIETAADIVSALGKVADAVAAGDVTPDEASAVAHVLEVKRRAIETADLESRISALEKERSK
jgi:Family of unknown function (DUF5681)